jgi:hypothetical protein
MSTAMDTNEEIIEALKSYVTAADKLEEHKQELKEFFEGKNFRKADVVDHFKSCLRTAMGKDADWAEGNALIGKTNRTPAEQKIWDKRESIRSSINRKAKQIIQDVFGVVISARDAEDVQVPKSSSRPAAKSVSSQETSQRSKRTVPENEDDSSSSSSSAVSAPPKKKLKRRDPFDGYIQVSDFKSVAKARKQKCLKELQTLANRMSSILKLLGSAENEWFIDGEDEDKLQVRWLALKPEYVENIKFRKYKPLSNEVVVLGDAVQAAETEVLA